MFDRFLGCERTVHGEDLDGWKIPGEFASCAEIPSFCNIYLPFLRNLLLALVLRGRYMHSGPCKNQTISSFIPAAEQTLDSISFLDVFTLLN